MKMEKGMILSSLSTLSSPLVSFLKNSKMALEPVAWAAAAPGPVTVARVAAAFFLSGEEPPEALGEACGGGRA